MVDNEVQQGLLCCSEKMTVLSGQVLSTACNVAECRGVFIHSHLGKLVLSGPMNSAWGLQDQLSLLVQRVQENTLIPVPGCSVSLYEFYLSTQTKFKQPNEDIFFLTGLENCYKWVSSQSATVPWHLTTVNANLSAVNSPSSSRNLFVWWRYSKKRKENNISNSSFFLTVLFQCYHYCASYIPRYGVASCQGNSCWQEDASVNKLWACWLLLILVSLETMLALNICFIALHTHSAFLCGQSEKSLNLVMITHTNCQTHIFFFHFKTNKTKS